MSYKVVNMCNHSRHYVEAMRMGGGMGFTRMGGHTRFRG
jgi:hypothetical protein